MPEPLNKDLQKRRQLINRRNQIFCMTDLSNIEEVKKLQSNLRASLDTPPGKEIVIWLEEICGWYDFDEVDPNLILIKHGKRQVLATIKTLLKLSPEQIVEVVKQTKEGE